MKIKSVDHRSFLLEMLSAANEHLREDAIDLNTLVLLDWR